MHYRIFLILFILHVTSLRCAYHDQQQKMLSGILYAGSVKAETLETLIKRLAYDGNMLTRGVYPFTTITTGGFYILATNVTNQITITVPSVTLDMNGCTANGIVINNGLSNITLRNGTVNGVTDGIVVNAGCNNITLKDITAKNCLRGITFDRVNNGIMSHCDLVLNTTGLHINASHNIYIEDCTAHANKQAGFSLLTSTTCTLTNCYAIATGDGNTSLAGDTSNVFGFVSSNGYGTIFERCIANSTQALTATAPETIVAGFGLRGTERCSKIISSEAGNSMSSPNGLTIPYGMWLENTFDGLMTVTSNAPSTVGFFEGVYGVDWSPDGQYLAALVFLSTITQNLIVYKFDRTISQLITVDTALGDNVPALPGGTGVLSWSPDGQYLAFGTLNTAAKDLFVFRFDQSNEKLTQIISLNPGNAGVEDSVATVHWSPDGNYLAVGLSTSDTTTGFAFFLYRFDRVKETLIQVDSFNPDNAGATLDQVFAVRWSPDGNYLAVGGNFQGATGNALFIYKFNRSLQTLFPVTSVSPDGGGTGDTVNSIAWSPNGKYIAVGGNFNGATLNDLMLYRFNRLSQTLIKVDSVNPDGGGGGDIVRALSWTADSTYLAVGGTLGDGNDLFIFKFNPSTEKLTAIDSINPGGGSTVESVLTAQWSPDGAYLAAAGQLTAATLADNLFIFTGLDFPLNNVISNNTVYCDAGSSSPGGVGISGSSIANLIIGNVAYSNPITPAIVNSNYQFVCNVFNPLFGDEPTALQNIALSSKTPLPSRFDIPAALNRLEVLAESLVDNLL